ARIIHLQHRHRHSDGPGRAGYCGQVAGAAGAICDDRRAGRVHGLHDSGLVAGEHTGGHPGQLHVRRLRAHRRAVLGDRDDRVRYPGPLAATAVDSVREGWRTVTPHRPGWRPADSALRGILLLLPAASLSTLVRKTADGVDRAEILAVDPVPQRMGDPPGD